MTEIQELLRTVDPFAAIEQVQRQGSAVEIATRYQSLVLDLYWKAHDLPAAVLLGRAGIHHSLSRSLVLGTAAEDVEKLRSVAKGLAFNVGSFTWPGWDEPGITPRADELVFGQECARLNFRLALELRKPAAAVAKAHWLLGAHALAAGRFDVAENHFQEAIVALPPVDAPSKAMATANAGYVALAQRCREPADAVARARFDDIAAHMSAQPDEDSPAYLSQLLTARRVFLPS